MLCALHKPLCMHVVSKAPRDTHQEELLGEVEALHAAALCHAEQHQQEELKPDGPPDPGGGVGGVCRGGAGGDTS
jgi:hypothetical protein